jgi:hypothetical protein
VWGWGRVCGFSEEIEPICGELIVEGRRAAVEVLEKVGNSIRDVKVRGGLKRCRI